MDKIVIKDLLVRTIIGVSDEERRDKQAVLINVTLWAHLARAGRSDKIEDTVNYRLLRAARWMTKIYDYRSITIFHIPSGSLPVTSIRQDLDWIFIGNHAVFGHSSFGAPAACFSATVQRGIKRSPVNAGLTT